MGKPKRERAWAENLTGLPGYKLGNERGIQGTGNEMIAVARALKHGFIVFFKAWPDTNYDLVIDHNKILFRVEVKGSQGRALNLTRGQRRGKQIDRNAPSRKRKVARADCDVVIGVDATNGACYILPIDYVEQALGENPSFKSIEKFKERWDFIKGNSVLDTLTCRDGLVKFPKIHLKKMCLKIGIKENLNELSAKDLMSIIYENV